ncbi:hypothetical protein YE21202_00901 [Yersinia enterocolitica (type O:9) str. YE212/02]|nr:hypothetical protein YE21202_00901 [Yersinia enterocolitica (type O:9) str. YE212/02]CCV37368.1 hypothetical protein YE5603_21871 [Yersinia enterocolitica (type O:9) str. YE56/03]CCV47272.1 hypothetical protein YE14902_20291 [Yersinia enterocolitica (type O:5,27) str. YE149/02]CCV62667.1 hypothetical protein YE3094_31932 [Yersinia enterocolitica (type O:2) str. YE3094/96]
MSIGNPNIESTSITLSIDTSDEFLNGNGKIYLYKLNIVISV